MPTFGKLRDGHDWLWFDVLDAEDAPRSFAAGIQREDAPGLTVEQVMADVKVYRWSDDHPLAGNVSRLEHFATGHTWVATRKDAL